MKILTIGNFGHSWDGSRCDEENIAASLEAKGHEVDRCQRELLGFKGENNYDFVLIAQWNGYAEDLVPSIKRQTNCPVVYWAFDYQWANKEGWHFRLAKEADLFLSKEMDHRDYYKEIGANFRWLPQDFAPEFLDVEDWTKRPEKDIDVLFTGTYLPGSDVRTRLLKAIDKKFGLTIYSVTAEAWKDQGFENVHGPVMDEELKNLIPRAKVNISIDLYQSEGYWSDRNAQIMACGGLVLFHHVPLSEIVFRDAVRYFYREKDMLEHIEYLLANDTAVLEAYAWTFARGNLMVGNRVDDMLTIVREYVK